MWDYISSKPAIGVFDVNGAFDSHTLPPFIYCSLHTIFSITAEPSAPRRLHVGCIVPQKPSLQPSRQRESFHASVVREACGMGSSAFCIRRAPQQLIKLG
jgi:hypothetical protein